MRKQVKPEIDGREYCGGSLDFLEVDDKMILTCGYDPGGPGSGSGCVRDTERDEVKLPTSEGEDVRALSSTSDFFLHRISGEEKILLGDLIDTVSFLTREPCM